MLYLKRFSRFPRINSLTRNYWKAQFFKGIRNFTYSVFFIPVFIQIKSILIYVTKQVIIKNISMKPSVVQYVSGFSPKLHKPETWNWVQQKDFQMQLFLNNCTNGQLTSKIFVSNKLVMPGFCFDSLYSNKY